MLCNLNLNFIQQMKKPVLSRDKAKIAPSKVCYCYIHIFSFQIFIFVSPIFSIIFILKFCICIRKCVLVSCWRRDGKKIIFTSCFGKAANCVDIRKEISMTSIHFHTNVVNNHWTTFGIALNRDKSPQRIIKLQWIEGLTMTTSSFNINYWKLFEKISSLTDINSCIYYFRAWAYEKFNLLFEMLFETRLGFKEFINLIQWMNEYYWGCSILLNETAFFIRKQSNDFHYKCNFKKNIKLNLSPLFTD